jgi:hypothetical protein
MKFEHDLDNTTTKWDTRNNVAITATRDKETVEVRITYQRVFDGPFEGHYAVGDGATMRVTFTEEDYNDNRMLSLSSAKECTDKLFEDNLRKRPDTGDYREVSNKIAFIKVLREAAKRIPEHVYTLEVEDYRGNRTVSRQQLERLAIYAGLIVSDETLTDSVADDCPW